MIGQDFARNIQISCEAAVKQNRQKQGTSGNTKQVKQTGRHKKQCDKEGLPDV
jgi:hypothetical protein